MLQHHTNWPGAYRKSLVFSSLVFWDVRAQGGGGGVMWEGGVGYVCVCVCVGGGEEARSVSFDYG